MSSCRAETKSPHTRLFFPRRAGPRALAKWGDVLRGGTFPCSGGADEGRAESVTPGAAAAIPGGTGVREGGPGLSGRSSRQGAAGHGTVNSLLPAGANCLDTISFFSPCRTCPRGDLCDFPRMTPFQQVFTGPHLLCRALFLSSLLPPSIGYFKSLFFGQGRRECVFSPGMG